MENETSTRSWWPHLRWYVLIINKNLKYSLNVVSSSYSVGTTSSSVAISDSQASSAPWSAPGSASPSRSPRGIQASYRIWGFSKFMGYMKKYWSESNSKDTQHQSYISIGGPSDGALSRLMPIHEKSFLIWASLGTWGLLAACENIVTKRRSSHASVLMESPGPRLRMWVYDGLGIEVMAIESYPHLPKSLYW